MKFVYILTKEGADFSDEGKEAVANLVRSYGETDSLFIQAGKIYNDPAELLKVVTEHPDCYIVISIVDDKGQGLVLIRDENIKSVKEMMEKDNQTNSWITLYNALPDQAKS